MTRTPRERIQGLIEDTIAKLLYYDRKEDSELPLGAIEAMIASGVITETEIADMFRDALREGLS